ncbi:MAG TPA: aspartate aminotransferase family protein, partial [Candidatus Eisenbacteria bacterium]
MPDTLLDTPATTAPAAPALASEEPGLLAPVYALPRLEIASGRGARVVDAAGREYIDFVSGIAVNALGVAPPGLARAVSRQMKRLVHVSNLFANRPAIELAQALAKATGYERVFFCNSGAEGIEAALKFARAYAVAAGRGSGPQAARDVVAFRGGFHGRTAWALAATWTPHYREPFEPLVPGVRFADYNRVDGLDAVLDAGVAAVVVEPVQGEGGAEPATRDFLHALRARTSALGALLVFDEIQCGMGRCGRLLAAEHYGVRADITVLGKALGGGLPLAAVLASGEATRGLKPGLHGTTFGGGPVATTAGGWMLDQINRPGFLARVRKRGRELAAGLAKLVQAHGTLASAHGLGLLQAVEIAAGAPFDPQALIAACREQALLLARGGERRVRFLPPLNVAADEITEALARFDRALGVLEAGTS